MKLTLGIPAGEGNPLGRRLAGLTFFRLVVLAFFLAITEFYYLDAVPAGGFSSVIALGTLGVAFVLSAIYGLALRGGRHLEALSRVQLVTDQLTWTAIAYISGGVTSGSTSLYGLTCLSGAILIGARGSLTAAAGAIVAYGSMCIGFATGWLPVPSDQNVAAYVTDRFDMVYPAMSTVMTVVVVTLLAAYLSERLRAFGGRLEEVTKRAEQAERLAGLGRLAAGLAHEIRNPLGSIRGSVELLRTGDTLGGEERELCELVEREVARLDDLVTDMVDLSRPREPQVGDTDLAATAHDVVKLAKSTGRGAEVSVRYDGPQTMSIRADASQMHQVLWNLVRNAIQASSAGATVTVKLQSTDEGELWMEVRDEGPGIADDGREHLFDAFFTTRSKGVGIGLAVVKQVTDAHGFGLEVDSTEGAGATFRMRVPKAHVLASASLLLLLAAGCGPSGEWSDASTADDVHFDDGWQGATPATTSPAPESPRPVAGPAAGAPASSGQTGPPLAVSLKGEAADRGTYRNTYYDFPQEKPGDAGPTKHRRSASTCSTETNSPSVVEPWASRSPRCAAWRSTRKPFRWAPHSTSPNSTGFATPVARCTTAASWPRTRD
jgi:signal transduction histidine kinase